MVADPLPSGIDFAGFVGTPPCIYNGAIRSISCDVGTLPADGAFTYSFNATVHASAQGPAPNPVVNTGCFVSNSEAPRMMVGDLDLVIGLGSAA